MRTSTGRILTTHVGSLPRPATLTDLADPQAVRAAVAENVSRQLAAGLDIINDGEASKPSYATYVTERLSGFDGEPAPLEWPVRGLADFPGFFERQRAAQGAAPRFPTCAGPVRYLGRDQVDADIARVSACSSEACSSEACPGDAEVFLSAASPGVIALFMANRYYASDEDYLLALAEAMKPEYDAIHQAGLIVQLDCPDLPGIWETNPGLDTREFRRLVAIRLAALDHATRDIPPDRLRMHVCWGNDAVPHHTDVPLADFIDLVLGARPGAVLVEGANPRHEHEWAVFRDVRLPEGKIIIPGVLDSTSNFVEHPELVAQRLVRYAEVVGKTSVIAGSDCGFASSADGVTVDPEIAWAKLAAMAQGARLASDYLWRRA